MAFLAAHNAVVVYAVEAGEITESSNGVAAASLPDAPAWTKVLGYTNLPQTARGLNNSKGFALGVQGAAYNKRGGVAPSLNVDIRPGNVAALADLMPVNGKLHSLCIYVAVRDEYTDVYRFCKPGSLGFNFGGGGGQGGGELTVSAAFQALAYERMGPLPVPVPTSAIRGLGTPLMWHDVRQFSIGGAPYRRALMSLSASLDMGLERKNERPNWGDDEPLSRTSYELLEHHKTVTGEISLHERLPETLFTAAKTSQDWGDISIYCSSAAGGGSKGFTLTLGGCFPSDETQAAADASAEIDHSVSFSADDIEFALES